MASEREISVPEGVPEETPRLRKYAFSGEILHRIVDGPYTFCNCCKKPAASGYFGSVYHVKSENGPDLAIKCPRYERNQVIPRSIQGWKSLIKEKYVYSKLANENPFIIQTVALDVMGDSPLLMHWAEHGSLHRWMHSADSSGSAREVACRLLDILVQVSDGLAYAHGRGITHADLKPGNILVMGTDEASLPGVAGPVTRLEISVCDFGISGAPAVAEAVEADAVVEPPEDLLAASAETVTELRTGRAGRGTPGYASPEQRGYILSPILPASDVWSFGILMRELLSRGAWSHKALLQSETRVTIDPSVMLSTLQTDLEAELRWLSDAIGSDACARIIELVRRALVMDPTRRAAMADVHSGLARALAEVAPTWYEPQPISNEGGRAGQVFYWYATWYREIKKDDERAERMYEKAVIAEPNNFQFLNHYADIMASKNRKIAAQMYEKAIEVEPQSVAALHNYAVLNETHGDNHKADDLYERAIAADPNNAVALHNYAKFKHRVMGDMDRAEELYNRTLAVYPGYSVALTHFAEFQLEARKNKDRAQELHEGAIAANPKDATAKYTYALFMRDARGDMDRAEVLCEEAVAADPGNEMYRDTLDSLRLFSGDEV